VAEQSLTEFVREARSAGAGVVRVSHSEVAEAVAALISGDRSVVAAAGLEDLCAELRGRGLRVTTEEQGDAAAAALSEVDAGLATALVGVAASGSILIGPGAGAEGLISILPPHFVALLPASRVVCDVREALATVAPLVAERGARLVFVTGPSRTSDIELTPVLGVHGPLRLDVVIVDE
jgi:L-lactate dehydrogenase complex protein LldG